MCVDARDEFKAGAIAVKRTNEGSKPIKRRFAAQSGGKIAVDSCRPSRGKQMKSLGNLLLLIEFREAQSVCESETQNEKLWQIDFYFDSLDSRLLLFLSFHAAEHENRKNPKINFCRCQIMLSAI